MYNITALNSADTIGGLITYSNGITEGKLMGLFVIALFFIVIFVLKRYPIEEGMSAASFICFIIGSIATYAGWLNIMFPMAFLIILALTGLYLFTTRN